MAIDRSDAFSRVLKRCQGSAMFFIENFCKVKHPKAGIIPFKLFKYQKRSLRDYLQFRYTLYRKCRQCGISTLTGAFALWYAMFYSNKTVLVVSKRDKDAMDFLNKNVKFVYDHLPEEFKEVYGDPPSTYNEHEVKFPNGSSITSHTSSKDTLRSNSASLNILDEVAFMPHMSEMWAGGQQCAAHCAVVSTGSGLRTIGNILADQNNDPKTFASHDLWVVTDNGLKASDAVYNNGYTETIRIATKLGYVFEATPNHRLRVIDDHGDYVWRFMKDMREGDQLCLMRNTCVGEPVRFNEVEPALVAFEGKKNVELVEVQCHKCYTSFTRKIISIKKSGLVDGDSYTCPSCVHMDDEQFNEPEVLDEPMAELLGYYIGDGDIRTTRPKRIRLSCDPAYSDLPQRLINKFARFGIFAYSEKGNGTVDVRANNAKFINWMIRHSLNAKSCAEDAHIPDKVLASGPKILAAFLRGLFEADGYVAESEFERVGFSTRSDVLADQVRTALLSLGIVTSTTRRRGTGYSKKMKNEVYVLDQANRAVFRDKIGFLSDRKNEILSRYKSGNNNLKLYGLPVIDLCHAAWKLIDRQGMFRLCHYRNNARMPLDRAYELIDKYPELRSTKIGNFLVDRNRFVDSIQSIEHDHALTADLSVPDNNTYVANGFVSHNTLVHGGCLAPDSLVICDDGLRQIGDYHESESVTWEDVDDRVLIDDGSWGKVSKSYYNGIVETRKIRTRDGHFIEASLDHRLRVLDDSGEYVWRKVADLAVDDHLVLSDRFSESGHIVELDQDIYNQSDDGCRLCGCDYDRASVLKVCKEDEGYCASCMTTIRMTRDNDLPKVVDTEFAELIGILLGYGFWNKKGTFGVSCDRRYSDFIDYLHKVIGGFGYVTREEISDDDYSVRFNSRSLYLLFKKNNIIKYPKLIIPGVILRSPPMIRCAFLRGLFETDGCVSGVYVSFSSSSIVFVRQVQTMLLNLGMRSRIYEAERTNGYSDNPQYVLSLKTRRDIVKFRAIIGFISQEKQSKLAAIRESSRSHNDRFTNKQALRLFYESSEGVVPQDVRKKIYKDYWRGTLSRNQASKLCENFPTLTETSIGYLASNNLFTDQIEDIIDANSKTYDITVDEHHSYIANGFISHNSVIGISTCNGIGNWYQTTWADAVTGANEFHPIYIPWWDMDWTITFRDEFTGKLREICPTKDIRKCVTKEEKDKWGEYYSPWLEEQYRALQQKGEAHLFRQEVLAEFLGTGNTVLARDQLIHVSESIIDKYWKIGLVDNYTHPVTEQNIPLDFEDQFYVWKKPVRPEPDLIENGRIIRPGLPGHTYSVGVDISSGEADDYAGIQVIDCTVYEQVAELYIRVPPTVLLMMVDYIGRWYNGAFVVPERTGLGIPVCYSLYHDMAYTNVYRMRNPSGRLTKKVGFPTSPTHKPTIIKALLDHIGDDGVRINGKRTYEQLQIYVYLNSGSNNKTKTGHVEGPGNHSDLVIGLGLALIGMEMAVQSDQTSLIPTNSRTIDQPSDPVMSQRAKEQLNNIMVSGGINTLMPMVMGSTYDPRASTPEQALAHFTSQLGGMPVQLSPDMFRRSRPILDPRRRNR